MTKGRLVIYLMITLVVLLLVFYVWLVYEVQAPHKNLVKVQVYFGNSINDPEVLDCKKNFLVERWVVKQSNLADLAKVAINELLAGPTIKEKAAGFLLVLIRE